MSGSLKPSFGAIVQQARDNVLKGFPVQRFKYVREGDFAEALRLLEIFRTGAPTGEDYDRARWMHNRLCLEPEDTP